MAYTVNGPEVLTVAPRARLRRIGREGGSPPPPGGSSLLSTSRRPQFTWVTRAHNSRILTKSSDTYDTCTRKRYTGPSVKCTAWTRVAPFLTPPGQQPGHVASNLVYVCHVCGNFAPKAKKWQPPVANRWPPLAASSSDIRSAGIAR